MSIVKYITSTSLDICQSSSTSLQRLKYITSTSLDICQSSSTSLQRLKYITSTSLDICQSSRTSLDICQSSSTSLQRLLTYVNHQVLPTVTYLYFDSRLTGNCRGNGDGPSKVSKFDGCGGFCKHTDKTYVIKQFK